MKKGLLFYLPLTLAIGVIFALDHSAWGAELIRLAIVLWCFIGGAVLIGRLMHRYWDWCMRQGAAESPRTTARGQQQRGVRRLAAALPASRRSK